MKTVGELNEQVDSLQRELADARVDMNIKDERIRSLEKQLRVAQFAIRDYEIGTHSMRTLALAEEEEDFNPRQTGTLDKDIWSKVK